MLTQILAIGKTLIDKVIPDVPGRDKAKQELERMAMSGELRDTEQRFNAIIAEATSTDKWTNRARPSFLYVMYLIMLMGIPMGIVSAIDISLATRIAEGMQMWLKAIPDGMWATFGIGYSGYALARSWDKKKNL